jgi:hypothetical protein
MFSFQRSLWLLNLVTLVCGTAGVSLADDPATWHVKAFHPDGYLIDVKAIDKEGNIHDVKALQDAGNGHVLDVKAFIDAKPIAVKVLASEDRFAPVKAITPEGEVWDVKAITADGTKLDVKGVSRSGNLYHIKAVGPSQQMYGIKALSRSGRVYDVKGLRIAEEGDLKMQEVAIEAHIKALPQAD